MTGRGGPASHPGHTRTITRRVSSYEPAADRPVAGSLWVWEPDKPHATALIRVVAVRWNGEEWWVGSTSIAESPVFRCGKPGTRVWWNDLARFWEACHGILAQPGPVRGRGLTRSGAPQPDELDP